MEQEFGEPTSATSLAARTVLPGEPFEAPASSAVPGPRDLPEQEEAPAPEAEAQWTFGGEQSALAQPPRSFEPASYDPTYGETVDPHHPPAPNYSQYQSAYATADSLAAPDQYEGVHEFGALPLAAPTEPNLDFPAPQAAPAYPAAYDTSAPPAYPAPDVTAAYPPPPPSAYPAPVASASWPAPMQEEMPTYEAFGDAHAPEAPVLPPTDETETGEDAEGAHRKSHPRPSRSLLILAAVVVLGGAGYFGYTQLSGSDSSSTSNGPVVVPAKPHTATTSVAPVTPVTPVTPATGAGVYAYPSQVAGFSLRTNSNAAALKRQITSFSKTAYPASMGTPQVASYGNGVRPAVVAVTFHPAASQLAAGFQLILTGVQKPATGNTVGAFTAVPTGAAGGSMTCGAQTGVSPMSICVWKSSTAVGEVYMPGQTSTPNTQALTREMRAAAEH